MCRESFKFVPWKFRRKKIKIEVWNTDLHSYLESRDFSLSFESFPSMWQTFQVYSDSFRRKEHLRYLLILNAWMLECLLHFLPLFALVISLYSFVLVIGEPWKSTTFYRPWKSIWNQTQFHWFYPAFVNHIILLIYWKNNGM